MIAYIYDSILQTGFMFYPLLAVGLVGNFLVLVTLLFLQTERTIFKRTAKLATGSRAKATLSTDFEAKQRSLTQESPDTAIDSETDPLQANSGATHAKDVYKGVSDGDVRSDTSLTDASSFEDFSKPSSMAVTKRGVAKDLRAKKTLPKKTLPVEISTSADYLKELSIRYSSSLPVPRWVGFLRSFDIYTPPAGEVVSITAGQGIAISKDGGLEEGGSNAVDANAGGKVGRKTKVTAKFPAADEHDEATSSRQSRPAHGKRNPAPMKLSAKQGITQTAEEIGGGSHGRADEVSLLANVGRDGEGGRAKNFHWLYEEAIYLSQRINLLREQGREANQREDEMLPKGEGLHKAKAQNKEKKRDRKKTQTLPSRAKLIANASYKATRAREDYALKGNGEQNARASATKADPKNADPKGVDLQEADFRRAGASRGNPQLLSERVEEYLALFHQNYLKRQVDRIRTVRILAAVAPLMGLLGTVIGMIDTFDVISLYGNSNPTLMAEGISKAMLTTQAALAISIPLLLVLVLLQNRLNDLRNRIRAILLGGGG